MYKIREYSEKACSKGEKSYFQNGKLNGGMVLTCLRRQSVIKSLTC